MAYNSIYTGAQIDEAIRDGEWYNLQCFRSDAPGASWFERHVIVENYQPKLGNTELFRLVFMRERRVSGKGLKWCVPMFGAIKETINYIPLGQTFVAVAGSVTPVDFTFDGWWRIGRRKKGDGNNFARFCTTTNTRCRIGCALFKQTGVGTFGWQRVSNIVGVERALGDRQYTPGMLPSDSIFSE